MITQILGIVNGAITAWNKWREKQRDDGLVDTGRQLQQKDGLQAAVKGDIRAQQAAEDVARLPDADLDRELRDGPAAGPDRK